MQYKAIPDINCLEEWLRLNVPFEYNDFMNPLILDNPSEIQKRISIYNSLNRDISEDTLHGPFYDITVHSADPKIRAISDSRIRQACEIAVKLKVKGIILHTNLIANFYNKQYRENWITLNEQYFKNLIQDYKCLDFYMENMFDFEPDCLYSLAKRINHSRFGICLDIGHCNISPTSTEDWIDYCQKYTRQYHINDNDGKSDLHSTIGDGNIDWNKIIPMLNSNTPALIEVNELDSFIKSKELLDNLQLIIDD